MIDSVTMPGRYFLNRLTDYGGHESVKVPVDTIVSMIKDYIRSIVSNQRISGSACDGGLYVGIGGIAYMFLKLGQHPNFVSERDELLQRGKQYLDMHTQYVRQSRSSKHADKAAFLLGDAGIHAVAAVFNAVTGKQAESVEHMNVFAQASKICQPVNFLSCGGDELLVGRAGYLSGFLWLNREMKMLGYGQPVVGSDDIASICNSMITSGTSYSRARQSPCPLMYSYYNTEYLGAAHGLCGILQMLISCKEWLSSQPNAQQLVKASVDFLLNLQTQSGNFPCAMDEIGGYSRPEEEELVHWCHGAPGVIYLLARAYLLWKEEKYLNACKRCGELVWQKGLLKKGPGICHGIAGSGYVFLLLYRLTSEERWLHRAVQFSLFLGTQEFRDRARVPDCPYSLYEGVAGTVCFLADLLVPNKAEFPFFDVFID